MDLGTTKAGYLVPPDRVRLKGLQPSVAAEVDWLGKLAGLAA
jgi:hypothetical protein